MKSRIRYFRQNQEKQSFTECRKIDSTHAFDQTEINYWRRLGWEVNQYNYFEINKRRNEQKYKKQTEFKFVKQI